MKKYRVDRARVPESLLGREVSTDQETHLDLGEQEINFFFF